MAGYEPRVPEKLILFILLSLFLVSSCATTEIIKTTSSSHEDLVTAVAFSPDGKKAASGGWDMSVKLWDIPAGREFQPSKDI